MKYTLAWIGLIVAFAFVETLALIDSGTGDTFSEHIWSLLSVHPWLAIPGVIGLAWAGVHLFFRKR